MITLNRSNSNDVVLTLTEKVTTPTASYLFVLTHEMSGVTKIFVGNDISTAPGRYNEFTIVDSTIEDPYTSTMNFPDGFFTYEIYNMPSMSPPSLDLTIAIETVETGKAVLISAADGIAVFQPTYTKNIPTWGG